MNILSFSKYFPNEQSCKEHFINLRLQKGVICCKCNSKEHYWLKNKEQFQCKECGFRTTLKSGTVLQHSKLPYLYWYVAMHLLTSTKRAFSAHELKRQLQHKRYEPIWNMLHKLREAMQQEDLLSMAVTIDDAYVSTNTKKKRKNHLKRGKGSIAKSKITTLVENIPLENSNKFNVYCGKIKMIYNPSELAVDAENIVSKHVKNDSVLFSDSALNYNNLRQHVAIHIKLDGKNFDEPMFKWTNIVIANLKRYILGTYHCIKEKYIQRYLNEFCFKFNNRNTNERFDILAFNLT